MTKPKWKLEEARRAGLQVGELVARDKAKLAARLKAGTVEGLAEDEPLLTDEGSGAKVARVQKTAATRSVEQDAARLLGLVQAGRNALKCAGATPEVLNAAGVGKVMNIKAIKTVVAGADMMVAAYASHPDAFRGAGVLPSDLEAIAGLRRHLVSVDDSQEVKKVTAKEKTAARNLVQVRVEEAIGRILAAAELAFIDNPERLAMYRAVIPSHGAAAAKRAAAAKKPVA